MLYLEDRHSTEQLGQLRHQLQSSPQRRKVFVDICLTRQGLVRLLRRRAQFKLESIKPTMLFEEDPASSDVLTETMIVPAIRMNDARAENADEIFPPSSVALNPRAGAPGWFRAWHGPAGVAAAILLPALLGYLAWRALQKPPVSEQPAVAIRQADSMQASHEPATSQEVASDHSPVMPVPVLQPSIAPAPVVHSPLATVGVALNASWDHSGQSLTSGTELKAGEHSLDQGFAQIKLAGGATVVLTAPARFHIETGTLIRLTQGRLTAAVPHGTAQLTVNTPDLTATDLGTEFGMNVLPEKKTHLEVFVGKVRADLPNQSPAKKASQIVVADQSVAVPSGGSAMAADTPAPLEYIRYDELKDRAAAGGNSALPRWRAFSDTIRRDPDLTAYYTFEKQSDAPRKLINQAMATAGQHDGSFGIRDIAGSDPVWSRGRWGKGALQFGNHGATAIAIPAGQDLIQTRSFSIAFWIKRAELTRSVHLINQGDNGNRCFNVNIVGTIGKTKPLLRPDSLYSDFGKGSQIEAPNWLPPQSQWFFVAITLGSDHHMRQYVNGIQAEDAPIQIPDMIRTADLYIGRTSPDATVDASIQDYFQGWMDELALFRRTLSDLEIKRMYEAGKMDP
jgi:hypothetical protein